MQEMSIEGRAIGNGAPCYVIAEAGVNHNGDLDLALKLVDIAREAGADAVKFQTFTADKLVSPSADMAPYQKRNTGKDENQYAMLKRLELSEEGHAKVQAHCKKIGITFLSSPFDEEAADLLERLGVGGYKIASGEVTNAPLLAHVARKGKPVILSSGMCTLAEMAEAVEVIAAAGAPPVALLQCVSDYPARFEDINLRAMHTMAIAFGLPVGYSDHTQGIHASIAAVALGACIIEKHYTADRNLPGPDHKASLEPQELVDMIRHIRDVEQALGDGIKRPRGGEVQTRAYSRKSLVAARDIPEGTVLAAADVVVRRPGTGLAPSSMPWILGRRTARAIKIGEPLALDMLG